MKYTEKCFIILAAIALLAVGSRPTVQPQGTPQDDVLEDREVRLESFQDLAYPPLARATAVQGVVVVEAKIDEAGNVDSARAISGNKTLIPDAVANAMKWKFQPNSKKRAIVVYDFRFVAGACHDNSHSLFQLLHQNFATITTCSPVINGVQ